MPQYGMLTRETLDRILSLYESSDRHDLPVAWRRPRVTIAGGGEPLIHKKALDLLEQITSRGFEVTLITNASRLTAGSTERLIKAGLSHICVSFWGIEASEYERAMKLPFQSTLAKVERLAERAHAAGVGLTILWVRSPEITSSTERIEDFWSRRGIEVDTGDNQMWNRGGLLPPPPGRKPAGHLPDPERRVWCADLFFSDAYDWRGTCLLCCCNYFTHQQIEVGNVHRHSPWEIAERKRRILEARPLPSMCRECCLPRDLRGRWLAEPILSRLSEDERHELVGYPSANPRACR